MNNFEIDSNEKSVARQSVVLDLKSSLERC